MMTPTPFSGRTLILIKHALPDIDPARPASAWQLGETGRGQALALADQLSTYPLQRIITSTESKAIETGQIIAERLKLSCRTADHLHEHERANERYMDKAAFHAKVQRFFSDPDALHFGTETASGAHARFAAAVDHVLAAYADPVLAIVAHGTVISLCAAPLLKRDPLELWHTLDCGEFLTLL